MSFLTSGETLGVLDCVMPYTSGIYTIRNTITGHVYYGSSNDMRARWHQHRSGLRCGKHPNAHLQRAWIKYGEGAFTFGPLCVLEPSQLKPTEARLLARVVGDDHCYNLSRDPVAPMRDRKHSQSARARISDALRQRAYNPESAAKIAASRRGRALSDEHRANLSAAHRGKKPSAETLAKRSASLRGKKRSPEFVEAARQRMKGIRPSDATMEAARLANIGRSKSPEEIAKWSAKVTGRRHSAETRAKLSVAAKRRNMPARET